MEYSLKDLRISRSFSRNEINSIMGWSVKAIDNLEKGERNLLAVEANKLSEILGVTLEEVIAAYKNSNNGK